MPNLDHDPQNPTDLLGQPIAAGDVVAWGTTYGRSPAICVCRIEKIRFVRENPRGYGARKECPQDVATDYTLRLRPIKGTNGVTWMNKETGEPWYQYRDGPRDPSKVESKLVNVQIVKNIVKLDGAALAAALSAV